MGKASDALTEHMRFIYEHFDRTTGINKYLSEKRFDELSPSEVGSLTISLLSEASESNTEFRPFYPKYNPDFAEFVAQSAIGIWKLEEDRNLIIKESPTALICFALLAGGIQYHLLETLPISEFRNKFYANADLCRKYVEKNSSRLFSEITNRRPMQEKTPQRAPERTTESTEENRDKLLDWGTSREWGVWIFMPLGGIFLLSGLYCISISWNEAGIVRVIGVGAFLLLVGFLLSLKK